MSRTYTQKKPGFATDLHKKLKENSEIIPLIFISLIGIFGLVSCLILGGA